METSEFFQPGYERDRRDQLRELVDLNRKRTDVVFWMAATALAGNALEAILHALGAW